LTYLAPTAAGRRDAGAVLPAGRAAYSRMESPA
jgi:hypothetical protein